MSRPSDIARLESAKPIRGLDHVGVQAPCIALRKATTVLRPPPPDSATSTLS